MLCFNIGGILAQLDRHVLVIDSDLQGNLTNNMGIDRTRQDLLTTYDIYRVDNTSPDPQHLVLHAPIPQLPQLDMIAGSIFLHKAELNIASVAGGSRSSPTTYPTTRHFSANTTTCSSTPIPACPSSTKTPSWLPMLFCW